MMTLDETYSSLEPFTDFTGNAFDHGFYTDIPDDWLVVIADIENSTDAVRAGQYESVNYVGAACITALNNALTDLDFPKVFGGDGAHAVVPPDHYVTVVEVLQQMTNWSAQQFNLHLITGIVPMQDVLKAGGHLSAGKLRSGTGVDIAMFRGNGLDLAEAMVKQDRASQYRLPAKQTDSPDLSNLSCRWSPIKPSRDHMLCIIVSTHPEFIGNADTVFSNVVNQINDIATLDSDETIPAASDKLAFKLRVSSIRKELASTRGTLWKKLPLVLGINLFGKTLFALRLRVGHFDAKRYQSEIATNSDYIKVAGSVKMVLDCSSLQADQIESLLEKRFQTQQLVYGLFRADQALMTCITPDINSGNHIHYIDGTDGGLWHAASSLKQRIIQHQNGVND